MGAYTVACPQPSRTAINNHPWVPIPPLKEFIAHGRNDPVMDVGFAQRARDLLTAGGLPVEYHESDAAHHIDPAHIPAAVAWLGATA